MLLSALGRVLHEWTGHDRVPVDLEGHGREELFTDVDLSRTVGWFTTRYPVALAVAGDADWGTVLKSVKEQLRAVPRRGLGYGVQRYLTRPEGLPQLPTAGISFNYLGQFGLPGGDGGLYRGPHRELALDADPAAPRPHRAGGRRPAGGDALEFTWFYSAHLHHEETVARLAGEFARALGDIARHGARPGAGGRTPSDFPLAALDQPTVDRLAGDGSTVEDIHPLTPTQAGMLFHRLSQDDQSVYFQQLTFVLDGVSDPQRPGRGLATGDGPHPGAARTRRVAGRARAAAGGGARCHRAGHPPGLARPAGRRAPGPARGNCSTATGGAGSTSKPRRCCAWPWPGCPTPRCRWCGPSTTWCWTAGACSRCSPTSSGATPHCATRRPGRCHTRGPGPARPPALPRLRGLAARTATGPRPNGTGKPGSTVWRAHRTALRP